jgi:hypothetical protein
VNVSGLAGGSQPHENRQPYLTLNYVIALQGIFPLRTSRASLIYCFFPARPAGPPARRSVLRRLSGLVAGSFLAGPLQALLGRGGGVLTLGATQVQLNSRTITLNNGAASALSQTTGRLLAETMPSSGYGRLVWAIGFKTVIYTVPMGSNAAPLAMTAAITGAGSSNGSLAFTTYATPATNLPLPAGVTSLQGDASYALDLFWIITPVNYTITPTSTLTLGYQDSEWNTSPNTITETRLRLQRWNGSNWEPAQGSVNPTTNTLTSDLQNTYGIFVSSDLNRPLPVTLVAFTAQAQDRHALLG